MDNEAKLERQGKLDAVYKLILGLILITVSIAIVAIFGQIYAINSKINSEVRQISAAQEKNHLINNQQNSVILGYLICIGNIPPGNRTTAIINTCVAQAKKTDTQLTQ